MADPVANPERNLLAAIVDRAVRDVKSNDAAIARDAIRFARSPEARAMCEVLDLGEHMTDGEIEQHLLSAAQLSRLKHGH